MNDQCKHCAYRGDIETCRAAECFTHESLYAIQQQRELDKVKQQRDELLAAIKDHKANLGPNTNDKSCGHEFFCVRSEDRLAKAIKSAEGEL